MSASAGNMFFTFSPNQIPIFDDEHFDYWSSQMETIFLSQDLWKLVEEGYEEVPEGISLPEGDNTSAVGVINPTEDEQKAYKENIMKNAMALRILQQSVSKTIYPRIFGLKKVNEAWEVLKKEFKGSQKVISIKLQNLWRDFDNIAMKDAENIKDYFSRIMEILNQLKSCGEVVPDQKIMEKILRSLPQKFEHVVTVIEEMKDLAEVSIYELMGSLEAHEKRVSKFTTPVELAFQAKLNVSEQKQERSENNRRSYGRGRGSRSRGRDRSYAEGRPKGQHRSGHGEAEAGCRICRKNNHETKYCRFRCRRCKFPTHSDHDCWYKNKEQQHEQKQEDRSSVNFSKEDEPSKVFYSSSNTVQDMNEIWFLDSGCSNHVTGIKKNFVELDKNYNSLLELGDSKKLKIEGKGVVSVFSAEGQQKRMHDVFYTPEIAQNLLSVGQMMKNGYKLVFAEGQCEITDRNGQKVAVVKMTSNNLFPLKMTPYSNVVLKTEVVDDSHLWHLRYGHLNRKGLALLKQKSMVVGLPSIQVAEGDVCEGCVFGRHHHLPFPNTSWRAQAPLELVHADICGPTQTLSLGNRRYFLLFVDDYTRMIWIYFLKKKSDAFTTFMKFKALAENQSGCWIKTLRTDRGGEFLSRPFLDYCQHKGIQRQLAVQSPTKAVRDKTPYEAWHRRKPVVNHLKVFGCIGYALTPYQGREKFDEKGEKLIFIGYSDESKGYRLYNPNIDKLVLSRDVIFDEHTAWKWQEESSMTQMFQYTETAAEVTVQNPIGTTEVSSSKTIPKAKGPIGDTPPRRYRSFTEIYEQANFALAAFESQNFVEAAKEEKWRNAMKEEMTSIEKNDTTSRSLLQKFKEAMMEEFEMTDLGLMKYFLGFQVKQKKGEIFISQEKYIADLLKKFRMENAKSISTPMSLNEKLQKEDSTEGFDSKIYRSLVGSLIYLTHTRTDIVHSVSLLSRFMSNPSRTHFTAAKRVLRYLKGTQKVGLKYTKEHKDNLVGYVDSDWAGSLDDCRSTSGYLFCIGTKPISWSSKKQNTVALSSTEAEYFGANEATRKVVWLRRLLLELQQKMDEPATIFCDNQSAIAMTKNPVFHARSKHIELRRHFIREMVLQKEILLEFISTHDQPADVLTKAVSSEKFETFKDFLKIIN
ncbi:hypothetical protein ZIOFF_027698 [Zingiber officinale]|uniref:Integrase catalytic domain-containing protein n=1 Tax=Zingiber officinale TaxID=94328 RepID=A0A8J5LEA9_ZINOF|nr:hypothetical protein ZIOFF_027698 [Zingiber officinale]